jgi:long-chain acyl-CoA synthetase
MVLTTLLKENAHKIGAKVAFSMKMSFRMRHFTYKEMYDLSRKCALLLQKHGVSKGDKVIVLAPNSPFWGVVYWGCLLNGAVIVPLNIQSTQAMVDRAIEQTDAKIVFKNLFYKDSLPQGVFVYDIEFLDELLEKFNPEDFCEGTLYDSDLIQILYTSGTTGEPKGVMLTHKNLWSNVMALATVIPYEDYKDEVLLSVLPLSHIYEQTIGFFLPQRFGAHVVYVHSLGAMRELMKEFRVTKAVAVPEFLHILMSRVEAIAQERGQQKILESLRKLSISLGSFWIARNILFWNINRQFGGRLNAISSGGAPLDPILEEKWNAFGIQILQGYGLTETSPVVTTNTPDKHRPLSVGRAIPGVQVKITKDGEVLTKGPNVFQGYYKRPDLTKTTFTDDGWFKTGDIGEFDSEKYLHLRGRMKYMIKSAGGQNVFPEDIEQELANNPCVRDSAVIGIDHEHGAVEIHAVLLIDSEKLTCKAQEIVDGANAHLASYQKITGWSVWPFEDFPRSATRKIQKEKVKQYVLEAGASKNVGKAGFKSKLERIIHQVTGISGEKITSQSRLVKDLGLDSLMRVELVARIEQEFGVAVNEAAIVSDTTVSQLDEMISKEKPIQEMPRITRWPRTKFAEIIRRGIHFVVLLISRSFMKIQVEGLENLKGLTCPVLFMPNHTSMLDFIVLGRGIPASIRIKLSFAAAYDVLYEYYSAVAWFAELGANAFPFPRTDYGNINFGLNNIGKMLDMGYCVVIFPEGKISETGQLLPLKAGAGLIATQMGVPVVPLKIEGATSMIPFDKLMPRRSGTAKLKIGKPLYFKRSDSHAQAQEKIKQALELL